MLLCRSIAEVHRHRDKPFQSISAPINRHRCDCVGAVALRLRSTTS